MARCPQNKIWGFIFTFTVHLCNQLPSFLSGILGLEASQGSIIQLELADSPRVISGYTLHIPEASHLRRHIEKSWRAGWIYPRLKNHFDPSNGIIFDTVLTHGGSCAPVVSRGSFTQTLL